MKALQEELLIETSSAELGDKLTSSLSPRQRAKALKLRYLNRLPSHALPPVIDARFYSAWRAATAPTTGRATLPMEALRHGEGWCWPIRQKALSPAEPWTLAQEPWLRQIQPRHFRHFRHFRQHRGCEGPVEPFCPVWSAFASVRLHEIGWFGSLSPMRLGSVQGDAWLWGSNWERDPLATSEACSPLEVEVLSSQIHATRRRSYISRYPTLRQRISRSDRCDAFL